MTTRQQFATLVLLLSSVALGGQPAMAATTINTSQSRFLDGDEQASWGPVFLKASNGQAPYTWQVLSGTLPPGLLLDADGRLEGITAVAGTFDFTLRATDSLGSSTSRAYRVRVHPAGVVRPPALPADRLPFSYVQSAFRIAGSRPRYTKDQYKALVRMYLTHFSGGEVFFDRVEEPLDFEEIRLLNEAISEVRLEDPAKDFLAVYANGRLPGFYPVPPPGTARAQSLKSDGRLWERLPEPEHVGSSVYGLHAAHIDITDDASVDELLKSIAEVYDHQGDLGTSVGPLHGFWVLDEAKATPLYYPFKPVVPGEPDLDDLWPRISPPRTECPLEPWNQRSDSPPVLRGGEPCTLYVDNDPAFSYLQAPKRALPFFSATARDRFSTYAFQKYGLVLDYLPADRAEFNDDDAEVQLESHVHFVDTNPLNPSANAIWEAWESWIYETWFRYLERISAAIRFAQAGNPHFRGVLHFQPPGWYSFRQPVDEEVIPYKYYDANDVLQSVPAQSLRSYSEFELFNDVSHGTDIEKFVRSPWLQGLLHETSTPSIGAPIASPPPTRAGDKSVLTAPRQIYLWNQEGAAAKLVTRRNSRFFGLFARYLYFGMDPVTGYKFLTPEDWSWNWDRLIHLNAPDYVSTLPPSLYLNQEDLEGDDQVLRTLIASWQGANGDAWLERFRALQSVHTRPAAWNPQSLGALWLFDGTTIGGWAYDPWSTQTVLTVHLIGSPNNCHVGGATQVATINAGIGFDPATDTSIRTSIRLLANYAPPEAMTFGFNANLATALQTSQLICGPGNYQVQVRVEDAQGDGRTKLLPYQGSTTLTIPVQSPSVRLDWMKPRHIAGFGPENALVLSGLVAGGSPASKVTLVWRTPDMSPGTWNTDGYLTPADPVTGRWYHSIAGAGPSYNKFYEVYAIYEEISSPHCTYRADNAETNCGTSASYAVFVSSVPGATGAGTMTSSPSGINCGADCGQVFPPGSSVSLTSTPNASSVFVAWEGDSDCTDGQVVANRGLHCKGRFEPKGTAQAKVTWLQPEPLATFGPPGSLVIMGTASGAPAGTGVTLHWRDTTINGTWNTESYSPPPSGGVWYHSIPFANYLHRYQVYVTYGNTNSGSCTYAGNWAKTTCP